MQRNRLRTLAVSAESLGHILRDELKAACEQTYREAIGTYQRIEDKSAEANAEFNLGHAYKNVPAIRNLDAAEAAYQRSLDMHNPNDALGRSNCIKQIGMVHHERFREARQRKEPEESLLRHAQAAEERYLEGLQLCPKDALATLAPIHGQLGNLYRDVGQLDSAREQFEKSAQYCERIGDRFQAGQTRGNTALMYVQAAAREDQPSRQRDILCRARAYAEAALRDFRHYQGRATENEALAQRILDDINQALAQLPE